MRVSRRPRTPAQVTAIPGSLVSLDCSLPASPGLSRAMLRTLLAALAPLYVSLLAAAAWLVLMLPAFVKQR
jgi:hypothetical protein